MEIKARETASKRVKGVRSSRQKLHNNSYKYVQGIRETVSREKGILTKSHQRSSIQKNYLKKQVKENSRVEKDNN